jgi:hypothetical protein
MYCPHPDCSLGKNPLSKSKLKGVILTQTVETEAGEEIKEPDEPRIPANMLDHHLKFECNSLLVQKQCVLIERARIRKPYARPWGITITEGEDNHDLDEDEAASTTE